jgi:hypothetical protein
MSLHKKHQLHVCPAGLPASLQANSDITFRSGSKTFITEICFTLQDLLISLIVAQCFAFADLSSGTGGDGLETLPEGRPNVSTLFNNGS